MSYSLILKDMLHSCSLVNLEDHYNGKKVRLVESKATDSFIEIHCVPSDTFVLDLDSALNTEKLFQGKSGECKRADYIVISESAKRILFIEMKRSTSQANDIALQLRGALCAFEYLQIVAREFFQESDFLSQCEKRFIAVLNTHGRKRKTEVSHSIKNSSQYSVPDGFLRISGMQVLQFRYLAG